MNKLKVLKKIGGSKIHQPAPHIFKGSPTAILFVGFSVAAAAAAAAAASATCTVEGYKMVQRNKSPKKTNPRLLRLYDMPGSKPKSLYGEFTHPTRKIGNPLDWVYKLY